MNNKSTTWKLEAPSVTLYAFNLRNDITRLGQRTRDDAALLWKQCVDLGEFYKIPVLQSLYIYLRCYTYNSERNQYEYSPDNEDKEATESEQPYLDSFLELVRINLRESQARQLYFYAHDTRDFLPLNGEIYPVRIHDTYALDLTLRYQETVETFQLRLLNSSKYIKGSLGQTLLLFAKPIDVPEVSIQDFANECVAGLLEKKLDNLKPSALGQLFGSPIFEYDNNQENPKKQSHILVWLNLHPQTIPCLEQRQAYDALLNLLCCRSKVLYAYHQSRLCEQTAQQLYNELEGQINSMSMSSPLTLEEFKQWLKSTPLRILQYNKFLRDIQDHQSAIATNTSIFRSQLEKIEALSLVGDNITFLQNFLNLTCKQFQDHISVDLSYLTPAQGVFQQMIDTIRGIVEIEAEEQAQVREEKDKERDRNLQITIAGVGAGIGFAGLAASSFPYLIPQDPTTPKIPLQPPFTSGSLHPFILVLLVSLILGFLGAAIATIFTMLLLPRSRQKTARKG